MPPRIRNALAMLAEARSFAEELERRTWDFAIEIQTLRESGLNVNDLRGSSASIWWSMPGKSPRWAT